MKKRVAVATAMTIFLVFSFVALPVRAATLMASPAYIQELIVLLTREVALLEQELALETNSAPAAPITETLPPDTTLNPQALVGLLCFYNITAINPADGINQPLSEQEEVRGSGVIINSQGDILTNRHIVIQPDSTTTLADSNGGSIAVSLAYSLDHCEAGQLPVGTYLPNANQIQTINPYIQIPVLGYTAQPIFVSTDPDATENSLADFAVLRITGLTAAASTFGITSVPNSFPYAKLLAIAPYTTASDTLPGEVVTYGFPGDVTEGQGNFFGTLTMTGSVGNVTEVDDGNAEYTDMPLIIQTDMEIAHGRSGSPLIWHGYVIGLVTFFLGDNRTDSGSVASDAIIKALQPLGYLPK